MFKKKLLGIFLAIFAVVLLPTVAFAQTTEDEMIYEDSTLEWDYDWDLEDTVDTYDYDYSIEDGQRAATTSAVIMTLLLLPAIVIGIVTYIYTGITLSKIGKKLNYEKTWYAWVPILNFVLALELADMNPSLIFLALIPGINAIAAIVLSVMVFMKICEKLGLDKYLGLLALVPIASYILLGILAWKKEDAQTPQTQPETTDPTVE